MTIAYLRKTTLQDLPTVSKIIDSAKQFLKSQNIDQWQDGYPSLPDLQADVTNQISYVLMIDGQIAGTAALLHDHDKNYDVINDGAWEGPAIAKYASIHRIAMSADFCGQHLSEKMISGLLTLSSQLGYNQVRIDTHPDNKLMQHLITKCGFAYCGTVLLDEDPKELRLAYQLFLK
ncbi:GCN5 family acetyltransferase [Pediococcus damnosus LMG 28219]|uniref:GNAT family N-acetyltransferase n=1 Tax=Pediococcus damnosus TaxID=51663 RepID=UPI00061F9734|nr:GNAT family N-acetyltransferase [Pediococcus damnosus]KJU74795.1 GCN5 family acetyltransferase [Pediococcus damnosus LMG 28219]